MEKQIKLLDQKGLPQRQIAKQLGITRHKVRAALAKLDESVVCKNCNVVLNKEKGQRTYCSLKCQNEYQRSLKEQEIEKLGELPDGTGFQFLRRYLIKKANNTCSICNNKIWNEKPIPLVIDHIDGNPTNNNLENLRVVCCNCDAQLPTYKGANRGNGRYYRRKRYAQGKSF